MIITEQLTINDRAFTKNYSDSGYYIERDGVLELLGEMGVNTDD